MKKLLVIVGDCNDADYITSVNVMDPDDEYHSEILSILPKISEALRNCKNRHNWPNSEYCDESVEEVYDEILSSDEIGIFQEFIPHGFDGIHSIDSIDVYDISNITNYYQ